GERGSKAEPEVAHAQAPAETPARDEAKLVAPAPPARVPAPEPETSTRVATVAEIDPDHAGLRGRVVESDGTPVAGLPVGLLQLHERELFPSALVAVATPIDLKLLTASTTTDHDGRFLLRGATADAMSALGIDLGGERATLRVLDAYLAAGETADLGEVVLAPSASVSGRIVDEQGNGVAGARVRIGALPEMFVRFSLAYVTA